ncbi:MAG: hypothetical protein ACYDCO_06080 [Armatimonadota bacterium]
MIPRPDLLDERSPAGIEVFQLTDDPALPSCHLYMEAQIFTPDSQRFLLHRSSHAHGSDKDDPRHVYQVCEVATGKLFPITDEVGATAPSVSPDGKTVYYFVNETEIGGGRLTLKRVNIDGTERDTVLVVDTPLPGTKFRPSRIYPLSTISSDGKRMALSGFLGDGQTECAPWGLMVFDLVHPKVKLIIHGDTWCNMHPQYSRSLDPELSHDILIQENHGNVCSALGEITTLVSGLGADIHVICDDGTHFSNMPWGRDGNEFCQGHQCWIGRSQRAITSTGTMDVKEAQLIEGLEAPFAGHMGIATLDGVRGDLSRNFPHPDFYHFATDIAGKRFITDSGPMDTGGAVYAADLPAETGGALENITYLLNPRNSWTKGAHIHPFLSPDGKTGFFNSDESGTLQAYMIRGL